MLLFTMPTLLKSYVCVYNSVELGYVLVFLLFFSSPSSFLFHFVKNMLNMKNNKYCVYFCKTKKKGDLEFPNILHYNRNKIFFCKRQLFQIVLITNLSIQDNSEHQCLAWFEQKRVSLEMIQVDVLTHSIWPNISLVQRCSDLKTCKQKKS